MENKMINKKYKEFKKTIKELEDKQIIKQTCLPNEQGSVLFQMVEPFDIKKIKIFVIKMEPYKSFFIPIQPDYDKLPLKKRRGFYYKDKQNG